MLLLLYFYNLYRRTGGACASNLPSAGAFTIVLLSFADLSL